MSDDGPGIATEDLPHVFERLYVAGHQPVRKEIGSGLGLAIVRELVDAMGGTVRAEAVPGGGARMVVTLRPADAVDHTAVPFVRPMGLHHTAGPTHAGRSAGGAVRPAASAPPVFRVEAQLVLTAPPRHRRSAGQPHDA